MISGDLVLKTSLRLSPGLTGVHGNRLVMSDTQSWGGGGRTGSSMSVEGKSTACGLDSLNSIPGMGT